ncbi:MAG: NUDIX domain-containing protein [Bacteroidota bacterium]
MPYTYEYPRPSLTVDCVIFGLDEGEQLKVLLIQRKGNPFMGNWAFPGGFVDMEEDLATAALRELKEETGVQDLFIEQLYTFGHPQRDPRGRVISVAYFALVNLAKHPIRAADDAEEVAWFGIDELPQLAFDHLEIFKMAIQRLRAKVRYQPIVFELLPEQFTLTQLQKLYETILGVEINKRNFRTKLLKMGVLNQVGIQEGVAHRPAHLYQFDRANYQKLFKKRQEDAFKRGVAFEI